VKQGKQNKKSQSSTYWRWRFGLSYPQYLATAGVGTMVVDFDTRFTICTDRILYDEKRNVITGQLSLVTVGDGPVKHPN
jgi:hypothetical protein